MEGGGVATFGSERGDDVTGSGSGAVVVDGDGAAEGGEGEACCMTNPARGTGYER